MGGGRSRRAEAATGAGRTRRAIAGDDEASDEHSESNDEAHGKAAAPAKRRTASAPAPAAAKCEGLYPSHAPPPVLHSRRCIPDAAVRGALPPSCSSPPRAIRSRRVARRRARGAGAAPDVHQGERAEGTGRRTDVGGRSLLLEDWVLLLVLATREQGRGAASFVATFVATGAASCGATASGGMASVGASALVSGPEWPRTPWRE